jgi:hypothetical protein
VVVQLKNRDAIYTQSSSGLQAAMISKTNRIGRLLGANYPVSITAPLASGLSSSQFIRLFLDQVRRVVLSIDLPMLRLTPRIAPPTDIRRGCVSVGVDGCTRHLLAGAGRR